MKGNNRPILVNTYLSGRKIDVGNTVKTLNQVPNVNKKTINKWSFGFEFFSQIKYFEVGHVGNTWFISLIERLKEISKMDRDRFLSDISQHDGIRYHAINWGSKNVPIERKDLKELDAHYLNNEEEYPMLQFHVSKALGRVVGFWDEKNIFQVVLLDPLHNIQPSNFNNYQVNDTYYLSCQYSSLLLDIKKIKDRIKLDSSCKTCQAIEKIPTNNNTNFFYCSLSDDYTKKINNVQATLEEIIELGLLQC